MSPAQDVTSVRTDPSIVVVAAAIGCEVSVSELSAEEHEADSNKNEVIAVMGMILIPLIMPERNRKVNELFNFFRDSDLWL